MMSGPVSRSSDRRSAMAAQDTAEDVHAMAEDVHIMAEQRLRLVDQRYTSGRRALVELLSSAGHPVSIGDIAQRLPSLPRSSAYRHLVDLQTAGLVRRVTASDEFTRFELAEDLTEHHHHLLCSNCGQVIDVTLPPGLERDVARAISQLAGAEGFQAHSHQLDVLGVCAACR
jgi:Fur family transcriptional regulator, ferric uptake regulator